MAEILFLAHRIPWPADRGDKIRSYHLLHHLAQLAPVHVGAFADDDRDLSFVDEMIPNFASVYAEKRVKPQWRAGIEALVAGQPVSVKSFASAAMARWVEHTIAARPISHIFVFSGQMAQYIPADFTGRVIMDFVDVDSAKFESYASCPNGGGSPFMRWINKREGRLLSKFEHTAAQRADCNLFVSEAEAELFRRRSGLNANIVAAVGNGIDTITYDPAANIERSPRLPLGRLIMFTGQMDYRPNIDAVEDFALNAMPGIRRVHPDAIFVIVGRNPHDRVLALGKLDGVIVAGAVKDVRSWLKEAEIVVAPLRIARGIQNKILEAMAMAKPVVASRAAAEGIDAVHNVHFQIAADIADEIAHCNALLANPAAARRLGISARHHVVKQYGWAHQLSALDAIMDINPVFAQAAE